MKQLQIFQTTHPLLFKSVPYPRNERINRKKRNNYLLKIFNMCHDFMHVLLLTGYDETANPTV